MIKNKKTPYLILTLLIIGTLLLVSVGLSIWLITDNVEIKPEFDKDIIVEYLSSKETTYNGNIQLPLAEALNIDEDITEYRYKLVGEENYQVVDRDDSDGTLSGPINAGDYLLEVVYVQYTYEDENGNKVDSTVTVSGIDFKINKADINIENIVFEGNTVVYDRNPHTLSVTNLPQEITGVTYKVGNDVFTSATEAGTYVIAAEFIYNETNYNEVEPMTATLQINKKPISELNIFFEGNAEGNFSYTGSSITAIESTFKVKYADYELVSNTEYEINFTETTAIGNYEVTLTGKENYEGTTTVKYNILAASLKITIDANAPTITVPGQGTYYTFVYNKYTSDNFPIDDWVNVTTTNDDPVAGVSITYHYYSGFSGTYGSTALNLANETLGFGYYGFKITASAPNFSSVSLENVKIFISKASLTLEWSVDNYIYNGEEQIPTATLSGVVDGDTYTLSVSTDKTPINADNYVATASINLSNDSNYTMPSDMTCSYSIGKKSVSITDDLYSLDYDSSVRTWASIKTKLLEMVTFTGVIGSDNLNQSIDGMHNRIFSYGNVNVANLDTSYTNVPGSTYLVKVVISNTNYTLTDNTFILKYKTALVGSTYYTVEDALATTGTTAISFAGNSTNATSYVYTSFTKLTSADGSPYSSFTFSLSGRELIVPYTNSTTRKALGAGTDVVYAALYIPTGVTINVSNSGTVSAAASIKFAQPQITIATTRGVIMNNGTINVTSGTVYGYGYIKGSGLIKLSSGAVAQDCLTTYDWPGGSAASGMLNKAFPANAWSLHNIGCNLEISNGAKLKAYAYFTVSLLGDQEPIVNIIGASGDSNCLFKPVNSSGSDKIYKRCKSATLWEEDQEKYSTQYNALYSVTGSNQLMGQKDIIELSGNYTDSTMSIKVMIANVATSLTVSAPIGYLDVTVLSGSKFTCNSSDYAFLPGTQLKIEAGATAEIGAGVDIAFVTWDTMKDKTHYLAGFGAKCIDKFDAKMILNGTLNVVAAGTNTQPGRLGGLITTQSVSAVLNLLGENKASFTSMQSTEEPQFFNSSITAIGPMKTNSDPVIRTIAAGSKFLSDGEAWYQDKCHLVYNVNGGIGNYSNSSERSTSGGYTIVAEDIPTTNPTREHYTFGGWFLDARGTEGNEAVGKTVYSTTVLYAKWIPIEYDIRFEIIDETGNSLTDDVLEIDPIKVTIETVNKEIDEYMYDPYVFDGWYIDSTMHEKVAAITSSNYKDQFLANGYITVYGSLLPSTTEKYTLGFVSNHSSFNYSNQTVVSSKPTSYSLPDIASSVNNDPTEKKYFVGWYTDVELTNEFEVGTAIDSDTTLYGKWADKIAVKFNFNGGSNNHPTLIYYEGFECYFTPGLNFYIPTLEKDDVTHKTWVSSDSNITINSDTVSYEGYNVFVGSINSNALPSENAIELTAKYVYYCTFNITTTDASVTVSIEGGNPSSISSSQTVEVPEEVTSVTITATKNKDTLSLTVNDQNFTSGGTFSISSGATVKINAVSESCIAAGTLITLADGTLKPVEELLPEDLLLVFNHETGRYEAANIIFVDVDGWKDYRILNLMFSDGYYVKVIYSHGFFDLDLNKYVYIDESNYNEFIGHRFVVTDVIDGKYIEKEVKLEEVHVEIEYTGCYSPVTVYHLNYFTNGLLSMPAGIEGLFNIFEYGEGMKYDEELMEADIEKYGLYTYDDFKDYIPYEIYAAFPAPYLKVAVGKGLITFEEILGLIDKYLGKMLDYK